ncbi:MAG: pilus assembly protein MshP [Gammaproteobacteria bacterium]|nr:pilus assembly protein MshP [Gammaproteobacteria bacterium]
MKLRERGFSLVTAIFLLVVVAAIGTFMVTIGTTQQQTSLLSVLSSRALYAADSGMEWAIATVLNTDACFGSPTTFTLGGGAASGYSVTGTCAVSSHTEGPDTYNVFSLSATASLGSAGSPEYIRRSVRATVTTAP